MERFLSCDWGTSAFRLRLVETPGVRVIAEEATQQGIAAMYARWIESGEERFPFYRFYIKGMITALEKKVNVSLEGLPLIMSGMVTSTMGMLELPYKKLPFSIRGNDLVVKKIDACAEFNHELILISGARTDNDVIRGEETQLIGCVQAAVDEKELLIIPGTHSKHIVVEGEQVVSFKTYMTGEFFDLLSHQSILSSSVEDGEGLQVQANKNSFDQGLLIGVRENLLHSSFLVRTNYILHARAKQENSHYLSGLLIGTELKEVITSRYKTITVVGDVLLADLYCLAIQRLFPAENGVSLKRENADTAIINGQWKVWSEIIQKEGQ
ncbi:MAG TPA: 2-dehydro-3-deoxygalactonokinase [Flavisolibacter sp.]|jgi:2-dehydro-3-deoxygalactonokinase|nr:2-dehydro-3-deoxygalactonokinase [Flavisolibacter sp.]